MELQNRPENPILDPCQRALLGVLPGGVAVLAGGEELEGLYANGCLADLMGRTPEQLRRTVSSREAIRAALVPEDWERVRAQVNEKLNGSDSISVSFHCLTPGGDVRWLHANVSRIGDVRGRPLMCFLVTRPSQEADLYRELADDSPTAVLVTEIATKRVVYANRAWRMMEGVAADGEVIGRTVAEAVKRSGSFLTDAQRASLTRRFQAFHIQRRDGRHQRVLIKIDEWYGTPVYVCHITDETEAYMAQARLQKLLDLMPGGVGVFRISPEGVSLSYLNNGFFQMLGLPREERDEYADKDVAGFLHPEDGEFLAQRCQSVMQGRNDDDLNWRISVKNGEYHWVRIVCRVVERYPDYCVLYAGLSLMDAEMRLRQELDYNRAMLNEAMKAEGLAAWQYDIQTREAKLSEFAKRMFGPEDGDSGRLMDKGKLHPEDWHVYRSLIASLEAGQLPPPTVVRYRASLSSQEWRWLRVTCTSILHKDGKPRTAFASALDVTDEVKAKRRYQEELNYRQVLGQDLLSYHRANLTKMEVEESHTLIRTEQTPPGQRLSPDLQAQTTLPLIPNPEERRKYREIFGFAEMLQAFENGTRELSLEYRVRMSGGEVRWVNKKVRMMHNPYSGDVMAFMNTVDVNDAHVMREMIDAVVSTEYEYIGMVDAARGDYVLFEHASQATSAPPSRGNLDVEIRQFVQRAVLEEDRERTTEEISLKSVLANLALGDRYSVFYRMKGWDGKTHHKKVLFQYLPEDDTKLLITRMDVTDVDEAERRSNQALEAALSAAQAATAAKSDFLARMSHEMRTPLNAVIGMAALGKDDAHDPAKAGEAFRHIADAGFYLRGLISDVLDVSRIESGRFDMQPQWHDIYEVLRPVVDMISPLMAEKRIRFSHPPMEPRKDGLSLQVYMDRMRLQQIFINLLNNACKFTPPGGEVVWSMRHVFHTQESSSDLAVIRDSGCGMSQAFLTRIGEPFSQEQNPYSAGERGTGLGLYIVKKTCEAMDFGFQVESKLGQGTEFRITTHYRYRLRSLDEKAEEPAALDLTGKRILAVEDIPMNLVIVRQMLEKLGASVDTAANGLEAVERFLREGEGAYAAVLMDIQMPEMDGLEAARAIRSMDIGKSVPIIAMTANAYPEDIQASLGAGMNDHLVKPIEPETLYKALYKALGEAGGSPAFAG